MTKVKIRISTSFLQIALCGFLPSSLLFLFLRANQRLCWAVAAVYPRVLGTRSRENCFHIWIQQKPSSFRKKVAFVSHGTSISMSLPAMRAPDTEEMPGLAGPELGDQRWIPTPCFCCLPDHTAPALTYPWQYHASVCLGKRDSRQTWAFGGVVHLLKFS